MSPVSALVWRGASMRALKQRFSPRSNYSPHPCHVASGIIVCPASLDPCRSATPYIGLHEGKISVSTQRLSADCLDFGFGRGGFPRLAWAGVLHTPSFRLPDLRAEANGPIALGDTAGTPSVQARRLGLGFIFCMSCSRRVGVSRCPHIPGTPCDATAGGLELRPSLGKPDTVSALILTWCCNWQIHWAGTSLNRLDQGGPPCRAGGGHQHT